jgi:hypothetical protein
MRRALPTCRIAATLNLDHDSYAALLSAMGLVSWFMIVATGLGFVRLPLLELLQSSVWTTDSRMAFRALLTIAAFLPTWSRPVRPTGVGVTIVVDAGRAWGAIVRTAPLLIRIAGALPLWAQPLSSTVREAAGAVEALRAVFSLRIPIDHARFAIDCSGVVDGATHGSSRSIGAMASMGILTAFDAQGFPGYFDWQRRSAGDHPVADALSPASMPIVWPLRRCVLSYLWDRLGGWDFDITASSSTATTPCYATVDVPDSERAALLEAASSTVSPVGWVGQTSSVSLLPNDVVFSHPPWSALPVLAHRMEQQPRSFILVAPARDQGQWWSPALLRLIGTTDGIPLGRCASEPPVELRAPGEPDPRRLYAYAIGPRPVARTRPRPPWWAPWMLTADGDIEYHPGPTMADLFRRAKPGDTQATPAPAVDPSPTSPSPPTRTPATKRGRAPASTSMAAFFVRQGPPDALNTTDATCPRMPPAVSLTTMPSGGITVEVWLKTVVGFHAGTGPRVIDSGVPPQLLGDMRFAASVVRVKGVSGSVRALSAPRRMLQLARAKGVQHWPFNHTVLNALAVSYAVCRLIKPAPPLRWSPANAATTHSDLSAIAAASARAGIPTPSYCGPDADIYLSARGARQRREHSAAWPLHLCDILRLAIHPSSRYYKIWCSLIIFSLFCLRTGIIFSLTKRFFIPWAGGYIFIWRHICKRSAGDVLDTAARSPIVHVTAATHPLLHSILGGPRTDHLLFGGLSYADLNDFVRSHISGVPDAFDIRSYGIRVAADTEAMELGVPPHIVDALFWWKRESTASTKAYYSGLNLLRMMLFSTARIHMAWRHFLPGRYACRLLRPAPNWTTCVVSKEPLPPLSAADVDMAWSAESPVVVERRQRLLAGALPQWSFDDLPDEPMVEPELSDHDSEVSNDCNDCGVHLSRARRGTFCDEPRCPYIRCTACTPYNKSNRCPEHLDKRPRQRR